MLKFKILVLVFLPFTLLKALPKATNEPKDSLKLIVQDSVLKPVYNDMKDLQFLDEQFSNHSKSKFYYSTNYIDSALQVEASFTEMKDTIIRSKLKKLDEKTPFTLNYNERVRAFINLYGNKRRVLSAKVLGLQEYYFPLIEEILDKYEMPYEMKYLSIVESALNPTANSRAGAKGLWQFMYSTGKMYGLKVTSYTDDRFDPLKSTEAACKYLSYLNKYYNDWNLALAAYNCGPGNVNKAIRRSGGKRGYWEIYPYLPRETRGYVPAFIAVNYVLNYPEDFGIVPIKPPTTFFDNDTVHIKGPLDFEHLALSLSISVEEVAFLNPIYKLNYIPNDGNKYVLKLPKEKLGIFIINQDSILAKYQIKEDNSEEVLAKQEQLEVYRVKNGDYLGKIASRYGCSVRDIKNWNGLRSNNLKIGQRLSIYTRSYSLMSQEKTKTSTQSNYEYYTIQSGDTFWDVAKAKGLSTKEIKMLNGNLNEKRLKPGDKIIVGKRG